MCPRWPRELFRAWARFFDRSIAPRSAGVPDGGNLAIIVAGGVTHHSKLIGVEFGLHKKAEVFLGCLVGLLVSFLMSRGLAAAGGGREPVFRSQNVPEAFSRSDA